MMRPHDGDFTQVRVLGKGAYGEVWLVTNRDQQVAIILLSKIKKSVCIEKNTCLYN